MGLPVLGEMPAYFVPSSITSPTWSGLGSATTGSKPPAFSVAADISWIAPEFRLPKFSMIFLPADWPDCLSGGSAVVVLTKSLMDVLEAHLCDLWRLWPDSDVMSNQI